jgi:hypothetical protein
MQNRIVHYALFLVLMSASFVAANGRNTTPSAAEFSRRLNYLNSEITKLAGKLRNGARQSQAAGEDLTRLAGERSDLIEGLAKSDPSAVVAAKLTDAILGKIPASLRDKFEKYETIEGELEVIAECDEHASRTLYFVNTEKEKIRVSFASKPTTDLFTGKRVKISGMRIGKQLVTDQSTIEVDSKTSVTTSFAQTSTEASFSNFGEHKVIVILVNFQDKQTQPFTADDARNVTFTQTSDYMMENSYGRTWLTGDVYGWYTIPVNSTSCDLAAIASYAQQAATNAGAVLSAYDHQIYAFPQNTGCNWTGSGSIGANPGQVWINNYYNVSSVGHELGHNFGLYHSRSLDCGSQSIGGTCTTNEYGDLYDIMGGGASAHINAFQKERIGWLNYGSSPSIQTITSSGIYRIDAYEPNGSNPKALKILKSTDPVTGKKTWYYVERRTPYGFDAYLANIVNMMNGVTIHTGSETSGQEGYILDMTPATTSWYDPALDTGVSFTDPNIGMTITTLSVDNTGAWVDIAIAAAPCVRSIPTVSLTPGDSNWLVPGTAFTYTATVTNNDTVGCGSSDFEIQTTVPTGWSGPGSQKLNLGSGASASVSLSVSSSLTAADGKYNIGMAAANGSDSGSSASAGAIYTAVSRLSVVVASNSFKYTRTQKATITATVTAAGVPVSGASVTFTLVKPNGSTVTQTATTGTNGLATFVYSFNKRSDPIGTYTVGAVSTYNGFSGKGSTSFSVMK